MRARPLSTMALAAGLFVFAHSPAWAKGSYASSRNVTIGLVSEKAWIQPGRPFRVGVHMMIRRGWHTYWKNPGDAGLPLKITWRLPDGFSAGPIEWPAPERIPEEAGMSYGYEGEVLLPVEITPPGRIAADSVAIAGSFDWLECKDVCLPGSAALHLALPVRPERAPDIPAASKIFNKFQTPQTPLGWSFNAETGPRAISLSVRVPPGFSSRGAYLFLDRPLIADFAAPQGFERVADGYRLTLTHAPNAPRPPERLTGVLVLDAASGGERRTALKIDVPVGPGDPAPAPPLPARRRLPKIAYAATLGLLCVILALFGRSMARSIARASARTGTGKGGPGM